MRAPEQQNGDLSGALEMVNKAIEEVRSEVEREKKKLSRIGDEPYSPTESGSLSSSDVTRSRAAGLHLAYDPGSYQITSGGYNLTPGCSKYTLDSDVQGHNSNSMEYVPTSLKRPLSQADVLQPPSPPPSPKYSKSRSLKYTVDNTRPSTDMEYDPLSNYSAGIAAKSRKDEVSAVKTDYSKACTLSGAASSDEGCAAASRKPLKPSHDAKKYTISDSDGESSGMEYRPTSLSSLQQKKAGTGSAKDAFRKDRTEHVLSASTQKRKEDVEEDSSVQESGKHKDVPERKKSADPTGHEKSSKSERVRKAEKEVGKSSSQKSSSSSISKDKVSIKNSNQDCLKKENKSHGKKDDCRNTAKIKASDKVQRGGGDEKRSDGKIKTAEKTKRESSKPGKDAPESKKLKTSDRERDKEHSKHKDRPHKNGKLDSNREKDVKKVSKHSSSSSKGTSANNKDKVKQNSSLSLEKRLEKKKQSLSLSHADLFGDESPDEAEPFVEEDDDDDAEEVLVRKSADALKRGRLNKRKASERSQSSSEDEDDRSVESNKTSWERADGTDIDFSRFQDDLDFDSDPMEECLRIFNESKDVKKEDKGRQAKQVPALLL